MNKLVNDFAAAGTGLVVYAASTGSELAHEDQNLRHGAFAEALIEAIGEGKAESDPDGGITLDLLDHYIVGPVQELTGGDQHPVMNRNLIPDFPLAVAPPLQANLDRAGKGLKEVCDAAVSAAPASGTKGVVEELAKGAVEPVVDGLKAAAGALWARHVKMEELEIETIKSQLEAAKWPEFVSQ
jgi:hypothetical protein